MTDAPHRAPDLGRRDRKRRETTRALEAAAIMLFAERGYDATTVGDIAAVADVAERTFFRHFGSKEEVIVGGAPQWLTRLRDALAARPAREQPLEAILAALIAVGEGERRELPVMSAERLGIVAGSTALSARVLVIIAEWEAVLADAVEARLDLRGEPCTALYARVTARCATAAARSAFWERHRDPAGPGLADHLRAAFAILAGGCVPPAAAGGDARTAPPVVRVP